jgi:hypothetical protein
LAIVVEVGAGVDISHPEFTIARNGLNDGAVLTAG